MSGVVTDRIPAIAKSKASISTIIGRSGVQWQRTGAKVNATFSVQNASHSVVLKKPGGAFLTEVSQGGDQLGIPMDEATVEVGKPKE